VPPEQRKFEVVPPQNVAPLLAPVWKAAQDHVERPARFVKNLDPGSKDAGPEDIAFIIPCKDGATAPVI